MTAQIIPGTEIARSIRESLKKDVAELKAKGVTPGLATVLVGDNPGSAIYVKNKIKACEELGMISRHAGLPETTAEKEVIAIVSELNNDPAVHGILVQLPLPDGMNANRVLGMMKPEKDVDGFHPTNLGKLLEKKSMRDIEAEGLLLPCTPAGVIEVFKKEGVSLRGANAVIVGRSVIVGKPLFFLLLANNATVTMCHTGTKNLPEVTRQADILVAACGKAKLVTRDMVKEGAVVIDVGINRTEKGLVGDVDFENVRDAASKITPVPGGVGPMTIAMLMKNTVQAARNQANKNSR